MIALPATSDGWQASLSEVALPILPRSRDDASKLKGRPGLSSSKLADIARVDASLGLQLLARANTQARKAKSTHARDPVQSVTHGISLLGVDNALECVLSLPTLAAIKDKHRNQGIVSTIARAHLASDLAVRWVHSQGRSSSEGLRAATQAHYLGELLAWSVAESPVDEFSRCFVAKPDGRTKTEVALFGLSLHELGTMVIESWALPPLDAPVHQSRNHFASLAVQLVAEVSVHWKSTAAQTVLKRVANDLGFETDALRADVHTATAAAARGFPSPRDMHIARTLLLQGDDPLPPAWFEVPQSKSEPEKAPETTPAPQASASARKPKRNAQQHCAAILKAYASGKLKVHDAMQAIAKHMQSELRLNQVVIAMLTRDRIRLVARFNAESQPEFVTRFDIDLGSPNLFARLLEQQQGLLVNSRNHEKVWRQLPTTCRDLLPEHGFCLMSLIVGDKPVGVFYADGYPTDETAAKACYKQFKSICRDTGRALATAAG